jgi:anti-sigma factor RsiW
MNCNEIGEVLMDVAGGTVAEPPVESHLRECAHCAARLQDLRQTMALLDQWTAPEPSPYFNTRLQARLREEAARPRGILDWFRKPVLAAAMAGLLVAGGTLYTVDHRGQQQAVVHPGAAVQDLQDLDKNQDLFANFDLLDDMDDTNGS